MEKETGTSVFFVSLRGVRDDRKPSLSLAGLCFFASDFMEQSGHKESPHVLGLHEYKLKAERVAYPGGRQGNWVSTRSGRNCSEIY